MCAKGGGWEGEKGEDFIQSGSRSICNPYIYVCFLEEGTVARL